MTKFGCLLATLACVVGCSRGDVPAQKGESHPKGEHVMSVNDDFFKLVQDLMAARPFTIEGVEKITGHKLHPVPNTAFFASKDDTHRSFQAIDMRGPNFISLDVQTQRCVEENEVKGRYGDRPELSFPTAPAPPTTPVYLVYRFPWGKVSFGFERAGRKCLIEVIINATGK
jgi:hypothetical protein